MPAPKMVGFFPKFPCPKADWLKNDNVKEICSVSDCIAGGPEDSIYKREHNELGFFDNEEKMKKVLNNEEGKYNFYAYKLYPFKFINNKVEEVPITIDLKANISDYEFLGFDIVCKSQSDFFECSPLSCKSILPDRPSENCL